MSASVSSNLVYLSDASRKRGSRAAPAFMPERVYVDREVADHPTTIRILERLHGCEADVVDDIRRLKRPDDIATAKRRMILTQHRGQAFKACQGMGPGHLCCGYRVIDLVSGCPMQCSYCILQSYLANNPTTTVNVNLEAILSQVGEFLDAAPDRFYRIGTGELADSLALDPILDFAGLLISFFARRRNALLELKTKTAFVDHLLDIKHRGRTVVSWSVNTPSVIASEERSVASLDERLAAARRAGEAGYGVGFHFDPIIMEGSVDETVSKYDEVVDRILDEIDPKTIAWISLGLLRYPGSLPETAMKSFPGTRIFTGELVPIGGKFRYPRFMRNMVYKPLWDRLSARIPARKLYLCMETPAVWNRVDKGVRASRDIAGRLCNMRSLGG